MSAARECPRRCWPPLFEAESESWLGQIGSSLPTNPHKAGILIKFSKNAVEAQPAGKLAYYPISPASQSFDPALFREAERLEFQANDLAAAADALTQLAAAAREPQIRDESLLRLARVQSKSGKVAEALATYAKLGNEDVMSPAEAPYSLLSRFARCQLLAASQQEQAATKEASALLTDLESGRFRLGKESYACYDSSARKLAGVSKSSAPDAKLAVAETVESIWDEWQLFQRSGSRIAHQAAASLHASRHPRSTQRQSRSPRRLIYSGESIRDFGLDPAANIGALCGGDA